MEPRIQYAKTSDGVNIAYSVIGDGPPLVIGSSFWGTLHMRRSFDGWERMFDEFNRRLVFYDGRGMGSSDHTTTDYSLDAQLTDLTTIVDHLRLARFPIYAHTNAVPAAIAFTALNPERVTGLVLVEGGASTADFYGYVPSMRVARGLTDMLDDEWESYMMAVASAVLNYEDSETAAKWASAARASMSPQEFFAYQEQAIGIDASQYLGDVSAPTLLIDFTDGIEGTLPMMRAVAAAIPGASLLAVPVTDSVEIVRQFLDELDGNTEEPAAPGKVGLTVIMFADIVDSTALTEQMGDAAFRKKARELDEALRKIVREVDGTPVDGKLLGDGVLSVFTSAKNAIDAALKFGTAAASVGLELHLGLHAGDVIQEDGNVFGGTVNIAARISGESAAGEVLVSQTVRDLARTSAVASFEDCGERELKGVGEPVRVWRVVAS